MYSDAPERFNRRGTTAPKALLPTPMVTVGAVDPVLHVTVMVAAGVWIDVPKVPVGKVKVPVSTVQVCTTVRLTDSVLVAVSAIAV